MNICETERLILRSLQKADSAFIFRLVNEPSFIQNIGDKGVRDLEGAWQYILQGSMKSYDVNGFGLWLVALKDSLTPIGICGLVKRDGLDDPDVGYAFLPEFWKQGYAIEAASAVMIFAKETPGINRVVAITSPDNQPSIRVLNKLGLTFEKMVILPGASTGSSLFTPGSNKIS